MTNFEPKTKQKNRQQKVKTK